MFRSVPQVRLHAATGESEMNPIDAACLRLSTAASVADERDRCAVKATDLRLVLRELARLQELLLTVPEYLPRD